MITQRLFILFWLPLFIALALPARAHIPAWCPEPPHLACMTMTTRLGLTPDTVWRTRGIGWLVRLDRINCDAAHGRWVQGTRLTDGVPYTLTPEQWIRILEPQQ